MNLQKKDMRLVLVWLGRRLLTDSDLSAFFDRYETGDRTLLYPELSATSEAMTKGYLKKSLKINKGVTEPYATRYRNLDIECFKERKKVAIRHQKEISYIGTEIIRSILQIKQRGGKVAIVLVLTAPIAEADWYPDFSKKIKRVVANGHFCYEIVYGGSLHKPANSHVFFDREEQRAMELEMIYISFNSDAPTNSGLRLADFIGRLFGRDITGDDFPDYSLEERAKMAWHINRENFNFFSVQAEAIPKYLFGTDNKPIFAI